MKRNKETKGGNKSKAKRVLLIVLIPVILLALMCVGFKIYTLDYYRADNAFINTIENIFDSEVHAYSNEEGQVFVPVNRDYKAVIVFYPGGKVEFTAYSPLMYELSARGYVCMLPRMPENLAFLRIDAADVLGKYIGKNSDKVKDLNWYIAGHSLGGVAAATYLETQPSRRYEGIILCASYTTNDLSDNPLRLLCIYGSEDKVLNYEHYEENKVNWPEDSTEKVIEGGIHSFFGSYGIQDGDGTPGITNREQLSITADIIEQWAN